MDTHGRQSGKVDTDGGTEDSADCTCKIGRTIEQYDLDGLNQALIENRRGEGDSLRELADYVNQRVLTAALTDADVGFDDEIYGAVRDADAVGALYETLTSDETAPDQRAHVRTRLTQQGIDLDDIESAWVTHPTVRTHLNECLDIDTSQSSTVTISDGENTIAWAKSRCVEIVSRTVKRLESTGIINFGTPDITVTIHITCMDCGDMYRPSELLAEKSCSCDT